MRWFSSPAAVAEAPTMADGLTVDLIAGKGWTILPEAESDWRSHAAAVAQSVKLIKKRLKFKTWNHRDMLTSIFWVDTCTINIAHGEDSFGGYLSGSIGRPVPPPEKER
ncbi:hypothetical protein GUJ93_ZPchr0012g19496 [Zizania palustris]|uniref:Uncharacterized protein n=1 Tax=Zizania palustris TaxID=103762 RepID=A0A8J5WRM4_ZIZPA|nr:hypothetical protein GUJ93_ZPchr0012g19496 [Zizania palustris]